MWTNHYVCRWKPNSIDYVFDLRWLQKYFKAWNTSLKNSYLISYLLKLLTIESIQKTIKHMHISITTQKCWQQFAKINRYVCQPSLKWFSALLSKVSIKNKNILKFLHNTSDYYSSPIRVLTIIIYFAHKNVPGYDVFLRNCCIKQLGWLFSLILDPYFQLCGRWSMSLSYNAKTS